MSMFQGPKPASLDQPWVLKWKLIGVFPRKKQECKYQLVVELHIVVDGPNWR